MRKWEPNAWEENPIPGARLLPIHPTNYDPEYPKDHPDMSTPDSHHRIGQLEGAIMAALPYLNGLLNYATLQGEDTSDAAKVIANLKAIVKEEK